MNRIYSEIPFRREQYAQVRQSKAFMEKFYSERIELNDLAAAACMSRFHYIRVFQRMYGLTPRAYLRDLRISKAKILLVEGMSITQVCLEKALDFYTRVLGFIKKKDVPLGEHRWLTVVSPNEQSGVELLLEPIAFEPARTYQQSLKEAGIPWTSFAVDNIDKEYERLSGSGVEFSMPPTEAGTVKIAILDDTCGNYIQLMQEL